MQRTNDKKIALLAQKTFCVLREQRAKNISRKQLMQEIEEQYQRVILTCIHLLTAIYKAKVGGLFFFFQQLFIFPPAVADITPNGKGGKCQVNNAAI